MSVVLWKRDVGMEVLVSIMRLHKMVLVAPVWRAMAAPPVNWVSYDDNSQLI